MCDISNILNVSRVFPRAMVKVALWEPLSTVCNGNIKLSACNPCCRCMSFGFHEEDVEQNAVFAKHAVKLSLQNVAAAQMYPPAEKVFERLHVNVCT